jgi:capsular polysaccharide biosynthesis protein
MAEDPQTQNEVARSLGMADLDGYVVRVGIADNTRIITVSVTGVEPQVAADVANALADTFNQKAAMLQGRGRVSVVTDAQPPERASGPSRKAYVTAAFALTLAVVLAWLVAREMSQGKVDGGREVEDLLGKPVIGRVPTCR